MYCWTILIKNITLILKSSDFDPYNICLNSLQLLNSFTPNSASIFNTNKQL